MVVNMILEIEDKNGEIYVCEIRECDENATMCLKIIFIHLQRYH